MITLENDRLVFSFPNVHQDASFSISFERTLRIPNDNKTYPLPPSMGNFPLKHLDDFVSRLGEHYEKRGGVIMPMHQSEAMWIYFSSRSSYPFAVKISTGKICAVSGESWLNHLNQDPQDYVVVPDQPWLDGYCVEKGTIRQFVAAPLGGGHSVEEQLTGEASVGGVQIVVYPMKRTFYKENVAREGHKVLMSMPIPEPLQSKEMGLAAGGKMSQEIYEDKWGLHAWDMRNGKRCFVTIANSEQWLYLTGERPPSKPPSAEAYAALGLPWYDYYSDAPALGGSEKLAGMTSIGELDPKGKTTSESSVDISPKTVISVGETERKREVREFLG